MPVFWLDMFAIKKSSSLDLSHSMQLCFRNQKGLGRDSDLFFSTASLEDFTWGMILDCRYRRLKCRLLCRAAARKALPSLISCCLQRTLEGAGKSEVPDFPVAPRQAPREDRGRQPVRGAVMPYITGWRCGLIFGNRQPEEERLSILFSTP